MTARFLPAVAARRPLLLLLTALLAHAPALPLVGWPLLAMALGSRPLQGHRWTPAARLLLLICCYGASAALAGWLDSTTLRLTLLLVLALKWAESRSNREYALVSSAAAVAVAIGLLRWGDATGLLFVLLTALLLVSDPVAAPAGLRNSLRQASRTLLAALPLAGILFLFFPRIPGPLWDIGLTFGLPLATGIEKSNQGLGISARLKPGQTQTGASDGQAVLVAEFRNWIPPTSQLYWRGPVFYDYDGHEWQIDADYAEGNGRRIMQQGWSRAAEFSRQLASTGQEVHYRVRLSAHGALWLYGLDLPSRLTAESFVGPDWQVLAHAPVREEISYDLASWLEWTAGGELSPALRTRASALPPGANPRLRALGESWRGSPPDEIIRQAMTRLAQGGYKVRDRFTPPDGDDPLDRFWFDSREGNSEYYATAFVFLMRASGLPARLVTGYRGGKLMALTDYVVVKRNHAHAWSEVWDDSKGWRRVDPVDIIAPDKSAAPAVKPKPTAQATPARKDNSGTQAAAANPLAGQISVSSAAGNGVRKADEGWALPDLAGLMGRWLFRLNAERQRDLLGGSDGGSAWLWLLALAAAGSSVYFLVAQLYVRWRHWRHTPEAERAWQAACRLLARQGLPRQPSECPSDYAKRIANHQPAWAEASRRLAAAYTAWRYGAAPQAAASAVKPAARLLINHILASSPSSSRTERANP